MPRSRTRRPTRALLALTLALAAAPVAAAQEGEPHRDFARRVLAAAGGVRSGEVVVITGGQHTIPLMEAVAAEAMRAGAMTLLTLESERLLRAYFRDTPERHLPALDTAGLALFGAQLRHADVYVGLPAFADPDALFRSLTADTARMARLATVYGATQARYDRMRNESRARFVFVDYPPTRSAAVRSGMDSAGFAQMQWAAVTADAAQLERTGRAIARLLERGKTVRVTTPAGTDLRLRLAGRPPIVDVGVLAPERARARTVAHRTVSLPGGRVAAAPLETSATGRVVIPRSDCQGEPLVNARFEFRGGRLTGFAADSGAACVTNYLAASPGVGSMFGQLGIGLNPALKVVETGVGLRPWAASGVVGIAIGNNVDLGGTNSTPFAHGFTLTGATVEIDGTVVVRDGRLTDAVTAAR